MLGNHFGADEIDAIKISKNTYSEQPVQYILLEPYTCIIYPQSIINDYIVYLYAYVNNVSSV